MTTILKKQPCGYYNLLLLLVSLYFLLSCSKTNDDQTLGTDVDARLIGTWKGMLNKSNQQSEITMQLVPDGTLSLEEELNDTMSCLFTGTWTVINNRFKASCPNGCNGWTLTLFAPFAIDSLIGDWDGHHPISGNYSGTFTVGKQ